MAVLAEGLRKHTEIKTTCQGDTMLLKAIDIVLKLTEEELEVLQWHINALLSKPNKDKE